MDKLPKHVAIIPDGNRRWARKKNLTTVEGHKKGYEQALKIGRRARKMGIKILTLWAFSTENWSRSKKEINHLMNIFSFLVGQYLKEAMEDEIRIIHIGRKDRIGEILRKKIEDAEEKTKKFNKHYLVIALDYGGQDEILRAARQVQNSKLKAQNLSKKVFEDLLDTKNLPYPNPDLIIRPGGEKRLSGFMLWQSQYSELIFVDKYFPDFTPDNFETCVKDYMNRQRRFGR